MAETTKLPAVGSVSRKWVIAGAALVAGIVGYAYFRRSRTPAGPTTPDEAAVTPTELPPADLGSVETGSGTTSTGLKFITTDAEWTADVLAKMGDLGFDTNAVSVAIGKWLNGQAISQQEEQWIFAAIALGGMPPSGSHPIHVEPTPTSESGAKHRYVVEKHQLGADERVRDLVKRFSNPNQAISTGNNLEVAVRRTQADPRNIGDIRSGLALKQHLLYVTTVQAA